MISPVVFQHESREALRVPANESPADVPHIGYSALKDTVLIDRLDKTSNVASPSSMLLEAEITETADSTEPKTSKPIDIPNQYDDVFVPAEPQIPLPHYDAFIRVARCESQLTWNINTGNGFYGGLQFSQQSWEGAGGLRYAKRADLATQYQQIVIAHELKKIQGWGAWPACTDKLGLR